MTTRLQWALAPLLFLSILHAQDITLQDPDGKAVSFAQLKGAVTVVTFISTICPISNAYNDRMNAIYKEYTAKGVKFIFVNANANESASDVRQHAKDVGFEFPVYKDPGNVTADHFGAAVTPESFVIDSGGKIRYHGQVDDNRNQARVRTQGLRMAIDAVLGGKPIEVQETKAFGCTIKRVRKTT